MRGCAQFVSLGANNSVDGRGLVINTRRVRRTFLLGAALSLAGLRSGILLADDKPEKSRVILAVGGKTSLQYLPLAIADRLGYFAAEGLDIEMLDLGNAARTQQALLEGAADVACAGFDGLLENYASRQQPQAFCLLARAPQIAFGVSMRSMPAYRRVNDLKGRKIGVAGAGSAAELVAAMVMSGAGLRLQDVHMVETGGIGAALQAVRAGQVDAMVHTEPVMTMLEQKGDVRIISDARSLKGAQDIFGGVMPSTCLFAPAAYLRTHPNTAQAVANAVVHALKWLQTAGPSDLIKALPETYLLGDRGLYLAAFGKLRESISLDGLVPEDGLKTALRALHRRDGNFQPDKIDAERVYTNVFARKAKDKFRA
jgi:NitT/TauT family transport system substrate-binding protein